MTEIIEPGVLRHIPKRKVKIIDIVVFVVVAVVIVALAVTLIRKLQLKNEAASARKVSNQVIADVAKQDGAGALKLGDSSFQSKNTTAHLDQVFTAIANTAKGSPTIVNQTVDKATKPDTVYIIYKYSLKTPYYIRVGTHKTEGAWHLASISGNDSEAALIVKD